MSVLFVAWRAGGANTGRWLPIGRLEHADGVYQFAYTQGALDSPNFMPLAGMPDFRQRYESQRLFPLFANRLLPKSRPEYEAFLRWSGFDGGAAPDPLAILAVTEGVRQTDSLEIFPAPAPDGAGCFAAKFFLHGLRHSPAAAQERVLRLTHGETLVPMLDGLNRHDPGAVAVRTDDAAGIFMVGYVPRYLARDVGRLCSMCAPNALRLEVDRVNANAPWQQRVLCRMTACWPDGFVPCSGPEFLPVAAADSSTALPREVAAARD